MALIKCNECGKLVSDKAKACPHCGEPVVAKGNTSNIDSQLDDSSGTFDYTKRKRSIGAIVAIVLGALFFLGIGCWLWYNNEQKRIHYEQQIADKNRQDSLYREEMAEKSRQDSILKANEMVNGIKKEVQRIWCDDRYLSSEFQRLIRENELFSSPDDIGCIDGDLWTGTQEGDETALHVDVVQVSDISETSAKVMVKYQVYRDLPYLTAILLLIKVNDQWRVDEIIHHDNIYEKRQLSECIKATKRQQSYDNDNIDEVKSWIQGNWKYRMVTEYGTMETRIGISGDNIVVMVNGTHYYSGEYEIKGDRLYYNRGGGASDYIIIDRENLRLKATESQSMIRF